MITLIRHDDPESSTRIPVHADLKPDVSVHQPWSWGEFKHAFPRDYLTNFKAAEEGKHSYVLMLLVYAASQKARGSGVHVLAGEVHTKMLARAFIPAFLSGDNPSWRLIRDTKQNGRLDLVIVPPKKDGGLMVAHHTDSPICPSLTSQEGAEDADPTLNGSLQG
jgi:hypothetical protein